MESYRILAVVHVFYVTCTLTVRWRRLFIVPSCEDGFSNLGRRVDWRALVVSIDGRVLRFALEKFSILWMKDRRYYRCGDVKKGTLSSGSSVVT